MQHVQISAPPTCQPRDHEMKLRDRQTTDKKRRRDKPQQDQIKRGGLMQGAQQGTLL